MKKSSKILMIMVVCAIVALGFGFYVMFSRSTPVVDNNDNGLVLDNEDEEEETETPEVTPPPVSTAGWKTYTNDKHGFTILYPTALKAGSISDNSVLGTFQVPVRGYHVGPLVFVILKDADIKKDAQALFKGVYDAALNPPSSEGAEVPPVECKVMNVKNTNVVQIQSVSCNGEGGPAKYAYITGKEYDVFVDGYSKGYANADNGTIASDADYSAILSTFDYTADNTTTSADTMTTLTSSTDTTTPAIQVFNITADDDGATPSEITAKKGGIIQITFTVGTNTYYGGLDFKSSVVNSGTVNAGQSKTISFKANESFEFTPYWPSSSIAKNYKIKVNIE